MKYYYQLFFLLAILFFSCDDNLVFFNNPQPNFFKNLNAFPENLCGKYLSLNPGGDDSIVMLIEKKRMTNIQYNSQKYSLSDTANLSIIKMLKQQKESKSTLQSKQTISYFEKNDTFYYSDIHTFLYPLGKNIALRSMDDNYFMNFRITKKNKKTTTVWCVSMMKYLSNGKLIVHLPLLNGHPDPTKKMELDSLGKTICMSDSAAMKYYSKFVPFNFSSDSTFCIINPDSTQLRNLIKADFFETYEAFQKQK